MITGWVKAQTIAGTGWTPSGAASLLLALASPIDSQLAIHAHPATDKLRCTNYNFAAEGLISTDVIDGIEFQCYGSTGLPEVVGGNTIGCRITLDGTTAVGTEKTFDCDGPGMQNATLGGASDPWGNALTGVDVLTATFGVLIAEGSDTAGDLNGRQIDYERMRIHYSAGTVPVPVSAVNEDIDYIPGIGISRPDDMARRS